MKVCVIFLDYLRHDYTEQVKNQNLRNAGYPFDMIIVNRKGISAAINEGISYAINSHIEYDAVVTMSNDILMPDNWLREMVRAAEAIPETGTVGIYCVENLGPVECVNGIYLHPTFTAFGNNLIPMKAIQAIGVYNEDYDPYGMQDADFAYRLNHSGFRNYYLQDMRATHIGHDVGNGTEYRKMKDEGLSKAGDKWGYWTDHYQQTKNFKIEYPEYIINQPQFEGEENG